MKRLHQVGAVGVVPIGIKAAHETNGASDFAPDLEIQIGADVGGAAFQGDFVGAMVEVEHADCSGVVAAHAEDEVNGGGLARAVWTDEAVDRAARHGQVERAEREGRVVFDESTDFNGVGHIVFSPSGFGGRVRKVRRV